MLCALAGLFAAGRPAAAQQDTTYQEIGVQVEVQRAAAEFLVALTRDSSVLLPARAVFDLVAVRVTRMEPGRRLEARLVG